MRDVRTALTLALGAITVAPAVAAADVRTIRFGAELGPRYAPAELSVQAGDVVEWAGDFAAHPLRYRPSPTEPYSAPYSGPTPLRRTLSAPGDRLEYLCAIHGSTGMRGVVSAVARPPLLTLRTVPAEPVAGRPVTFIASYTPAERGARYTRFSWDLDGDGRVRTKDGDRITAGPRVTTMYPRAGQRRMSVTASTRKVGAASTSTTRLRFVVAATADNTAPRVRVLALGPLALREMLRTGLVATVRSSEVARARVDVLHDGRVLARTEQRISSRAAGVRLRFSARSAASLRRLRDVRLKLRIVARDDAGNRMTLRKTFIVR